VERHCPQQASAPVQAHNGQQNNHHAGNGSANRGSRGGGRGGLRGRGGGSFTRGGNNNARPSRVNPRPTNAGPPAKVKPELKIRLFSTGNIWKESTTTRAECHKLSVCPTATDS